MGAVAETDITRSPADTLLQRLLASGWRFDFFQAVWLLERFCAGGTTVGGRGPVADEPIRFRPHVSLGFPPSDVRRIAALPGVTGDKPLYQLDVTFMGLYGVSTPLPLHFAVDVLRSVEPYESPLPEQGEPVPADEVPKAAGPREATPVRDFLDVFHHRLVSLFYRSWTKYRYDVTFSTPGRDSITDYLLWLIGCSRDYDEAVLGVSPIRLLRYAGLLTQHPGPAVALEGLLDDYWGGFAVQVEQCIGRWVPLAEADLNVLGVCNSSLGVDLTVGEQVYDLSGAFNVALGPMDWETYLTFLPGQPGFEQTRSLVQFYCSDPLSFTIEVKLREGEIHDMRLSSDEDACRLGYTSWAQTGRLPETSVTFVTAGPAYTEGGGDLQPARVEAPDEAVVA